jgi:amino acid transporter
MLSTIGMLETSILQFTRTLFSMSRDTALHPPPVYRTPWVATLLITGLGPRPALRVLVPARHQDRH